MAIDFSSALAYESEQRFKNELLGALKTLSEQVLELQKKVDAQAKPSKTAKE